MNNKELYVIPGTMIFFVINISLFFKVLEFNFAIEYFFAIFISLSYTVLGFRILFVSNFLTFYLVGFFIGAGVFFYTGSFLLPTKIYLATELFVLVSLQKFEIAYTKKSQNIDNQELIKDYKSGMKNKDICKKYNMQPYQVTRLKDKIIKKNAKHN